MPLTVSGSRHLETDKTPNYDWYTITLTFGSFHLRSSIPEQGPGGDCWGEEVGWD